MFENLWPVCVVGLTLAAGLVSLCLPLAMLLRHARLRSEQVHAERMKALEARCPLQILEPAQDQRQFIANAFWIAFWLGAGVPIAGLWAAAWVTAQREGIGYAVVIWISVALAAVAGVVCATVVLLRSRPAPPAKIAASAEPDARP